MFLIAIELARCLCARISKVQFSFLQFLDGHFNLGFRPRFFKQFYCKILDQIHSKSERLGPSLLEGAGRSELIYF